MNDDHDQHYCQTPGNTGGHAPLPLHVYAPEGRPEWLYWTIILLALAAGAVLLALLAWAL